MSRTVFSLSRRTATWIIACGLCLTSGCGWGKKTEQIQRGIENVDAHAKQIEDAATPPAGGKPAVDEQRDIEP